MSPKQNADRQSQQGNARQGFEQPSSDRRAEETLDSIEADRPETVTAKRHRDVNGRQPREVPARRTGRQKDRYDNEVERRDRWIQQVDREPLPKADGSRLPFGLSTMSRGRRGLQTNPTVLKACDPIQAEYSKPRKEQRTTNAEHRHRDRPSSENECQPETGGRRMRRVANRGPCCGRDPCGRPATQRVPHHDGRRGAGRDDEDEGECDVGDEQRIHASKPYLNRSQGRSRLPRFVTS
jgi:hypothetical protein